MSDQPVPQERVALVTGANKGVGLAIARRLHELGMFVYLGSRDPARGEAAVRAVGSGRARLLPLDVTAEESVRAAARHIDAASGRLDVLVNNAGINVQPARPPSETPVEDVRRTFETNVFGVVAVTNAMLPLLRRSGAGRVVNLSSDLGSLANAAANETQWGAFPLLLAYNASKTALNAVTVAYARELRDTGILVNAVSPGYVATDLNGFAGVLTPEQGARVPVRFATLGADGPTGVFVAEDGTPTGRTVPW